jgi:hypothetical protein
VSARRRAAPRAGRAKARRPSRARARPVGGAAVAPLTPKDVDRLRRHLERQVAQAEPRWNASPEDVQRAVARLVLTLVEFLRQLLERQAIRRMDAGTLTPAEIEAIGLALMRLERTLKDLARRFGLSADELNLQLGPLGRLL